MFKRILAFFFLASITLPAQAGFMAGTLGHVQGDTEEIPAKQQIYHDDKGKPATDQKQEQPASIFAEQCPDDVIDSLLDWSFV